MNPKRRSQIRRVGVGVLALTTLATVSLIASPQRIYGGARAAEAAGDTKAATYYKKLLEVAPDADTERPKLERPKKFVEPRVSAR